MELSSAAFLNWLLKKPKGVKALTTLIDTRLTTTRATNLDNLQFITAGEVAAQAKIGAPTDAVSANTTLFALAQACELLICDIETKARQIAAAQAQTLTVTVNIVKETTVTTSVWQQQAWSWDNGSQGACATSIPYGGYGFNWALAPDTGPGNDALAIGGCSIAGSGRGTAGYFTSVTQAVETLTPTPLSSTIPGVSLPPLGGCGASVAGGVQIVLNGYTPIGAQPVGPFYPFTLGNPFVSNAPYIGIYCDPVQKKFKFVAQTEAGVASAVEVPQSVAFYPCTITWSAAGGELVTADGTTYTIGATYMPQPSTLLQAMIPQAGSSYLTYINVQHV